MVSEIGLTESMWQLQLEPISPGYPKRPCEPNCSYYMRTGYCGYGDRCRFHHPRDRSVCVDFRQVFGGGRIGGGEYPKRAGQPACKYFLKTGTCKYGSSCKYDHPRQGAGSTHTVPLNYYGFPLRLGERECAYYMRTGKCRFGLTCKFHHPEPTVLPAPYIQPPYGSVLISTGVVSVQGWNPYPPTVNPLLSPGGQHGVQTGSLFSSSNPLSLSASAFPRPNTEVPSATGLPLRPVNEGSSIVGNATVG